MKILRTHQYESIAKSWLNHFRSVAKTNKYAKGKKYDIVETERVNTLGFTIIDYNVIELNK